MILRHLYVQKYFSPLKQGKFNQNLSACVYMYFLKFRQ
jgi:hypothetical protein